MSDFRQRHRIVTFNKKTQQRKGWLTGAQAANSLGISAMSVTRLVQAGVLPAEQPLPGLPAVISSGCSTDRGRDAQSDERRIYRGRTES